MYALWQRMTERYYRFWVRLANLKNKTQILPIDFKKPWTGVLFAQKKLLTVAIACETVIQAFYALYPYFIGLIIESTSYTAFFTLMAIWFVINMIEYVSVYVSALLEIQCINSIQFNAFNYFLTVDPIYHTMKASGKLFAKIERCARAYEDFIDIVLWDILPIFVSVTAVVTTFLLTDRTLGLAAMGLLAVIAFVNIFLNLFTSTTFETRIIAADDAVKTLSVESLTQVQLIRSSFATNEISDKGKELNSETMYTEGTGWLAFASATALSRFAYLFSITVLGWIILNAITRGSVSIIGGSSLLLTYINGTYEINAVGRRLRKLIKAVTRINDLYSFIKDFGKQTFPVLTNQGMQVAQGAQQAVKGDIITLEARDIHFDYNPKAKIFDHQNLFLQVPQSQPDKLYGIIGPSGMGKTTLLSLLGGQLKPDSGTIFLNGVSIYTINDEMRRRLIAVQGQVASSLSGTVHSNLLLGLPAHKRIYSDDDIITVLKKVGIWPIFEEKQGLETPIGESGLTLSGGQRQRLNFAGLYLRAHYYKPLLILIDEPTSSLDEVSERAITTMISELAQDALTLVIAHRIKTLDDAVAILDFSLLDGEKDSTFYTREELAKKSSYYRRLMQGDITIDA